MIQSHTTKSRLNPRCLPIPPVLRTANSLMNFIFLENEYFNGNCLQYPHSLLLVSVQFKPYDHSPDVAKFLNYSLHGQELVSHLLIICPVNMPIKVEGGVDDQSIRDQHSIGIWMKYGTGSSP